MPRNPLEGYGVPLRSRGRQRDGTPVTLEGGMQLMYAVSVQTIDDGDFWDDPTWFDTKDEAKAFAATSACPEGYEVVVWECQVVN